MSLAVKVAIERTATRSQKYSIKLLSLVALIVISTSQLLAHQLPPTIQQQQQRQELLESQCLACIRSVTSVGVDLSRRCEGGYYCGPFQFSYQYWAEAGKPGNQQGIREFEKCARDKQCAEQTVRAYSRKFKRDCNNDGHLDCLDMAALHKAGPASCSQDWFYKSRYWLAFNKTSCSINRTPDDPATAVAIVQPDAQDASKQYRPMQAAIKNQTLTSECLDCICEGLTGCSAAGAAAAAPKSTADSCEPGHLCGPFAISQAHWKDGRRPGASWTICSRSRECASLAIQNYMEKHKRDCNNDGLITCEDYAAIHRRGPMSCTNRDLLKEQYWIRFQACRAHQKPQMHDANTVRLEELAEQTTKSTTTTTTTQTSTILTSRANVDVEQLMTTQSVAPSRQTSPPPPTQTTTSTTSTTSNTYGLNPQLVYETKANSNTVRMNSKPQSYDSQSYSHDHHYPDISTQTTTTQSETQAPRRPLIDYSPQLPVIIVSKLLNAQSTTRISQPPPPSSDYITTTYSPLTTTSMTTAPPPTQPTRQQSTQFAYSELTTSYPSSSSSGSPSNFNAGDQMNMAADYASTLLDFGPNGVDSVVANIDKAVIDIMANPDFSKSYPPVNESMIMQRKQQVNPSTSSTRHTGQQQLDNSSQSTTSQQQAATSSNNKRENSKTLSPNIYNNMDSIEQTSNSNNSPSQIVGPDALNMSAIFNDKSFSLGPNESSSRIAGECLDCICDASSNCDSTVQCISKQREKNRCGLYMISWNQYKESDISLTSLFSSGSQQTANNDDYDEKLYYECTTDKNCAEKLIHLYIEKFQMDCNGDGKIDCYDIAAIHRVGPESCNSSKFLSSQYWSDFNHCYATDRLTTTTIQPFASSAPGQTQTQQNGTS